MKMEASELILNEDGSVYHLHLLPEDIADDIILVGDPERINIVASFFSKIELEKQNREFHTITGFFKQKRVTVISTGIGTDNIDIVLNELDALANINLKTRSLNNNHRALNFIRIGTSGSIQKNIPVNSFLISNKAIGFDGLLNFYANRDKVSDLEFEDFFKSKVNWNKLLASPYVVSCSKILLDKLKGDTFIKGVTISSPGFYGPQGRLLRLKTIDPKLNGKIEAFEYKEEKVTNYEMECSAIYGLSRLLGHNAITVCVIIANRVTKEYSKDYKNIIKDLIKIILNRL